MYIYIYITYIYIYIYILNIYIYIYIYIYILLISFYYSRIYTDEIHWFSSCKINANSWIIVMRRVCFSKFALLRHGFV